MAYVHATQPRGIKQLVFSSLTLYRKAFFHVILLAMIVAITANVPRVLIYAFGHSFFAGTTPFSPGRLWFIVLDLIGLTFFSAIIWRLHCYIKVSHEAYKDDIIKGLRKIPRIFVAVVLQMIILWSLLFIMYSFYAYLQSQGLLWQTSILPILLVATPFLITLGIFIRNRFYA